MNNDNEPFQIIPQPQQYQCRGLRRQHDPNYSNVSCLIRSVADAVSLFAIRFDNLRLQRSSRGKWNF